MNSQHNIENLINRHLITVQKPGRYVGGEFNQIIKNWNETQVHAALAFPDIYDIGFPNLGIAGLYNAINNIPDALAERVFCPWFDMEELLRSKDIPLFTLETHRPIGEFDIVGFSLAYETLYTNVLNILDLGKIPIFSEKRDEHHPIIVAGGHATYNPEPMYAFIDVFVIGEGEIVITEIIQALIQLQGETRAVKLAALGEIPGIYIPSKFRISTDTNGSPQEKPSGPIVRKRIIKKIKKPIQNLLVPNISVVHDRISIEIMRGCSRGCRFCQAGMVMRPVREVEPEVIVDAVKESINKTGISDISLLSLSTSDHSQVTEILDGINQLSKKYQIDFTLPSLRIESFNQEVMDAMDTKRKGNFTIAPEAGSEKLRKSINKDISPQNILGTVEQICKKGWNNIKLYFMIGFPGETMEDIDCIIELCQEIQAIGRNTLKGRFKLHVSVNTLIPKAHTAFQWAALETRESNEEKYSKMREGLRQLRIKINYPDYDQIQLEALLSRGDRNLSTLIFKAWEKGAKFDAWNEGFSSMIWREAINEAGIDLGRYLYTEKHPDESLPWDHIDTGVEKSFLASEYLKSKTGELTTGCFQHCAKCGVNQNLVINCSKARVGQI